MEGLTAELLERLATNGPPLLFALTFLETCFITGLVVPAGVALLFASALAAVGTLPLAQVTAFAVAGAAVGDSVGFWVGRKSGEGWRKSRLLGGDRNAARRARMERILAASPVVSISMARVVSFVRTVMPLAAGASEIGYRRFLVFDLLGIAMWAGVYVGVGWLAGEYGPSANGILGVVGVVAFAIAVRTVLRKSRMEPTTALHSVALTGNVGAGKSTVAEVWKDAGVPVVSADELARTASDPGTPGLAEIERVFGPEAVAADGSLDRAWLRERVFGDDAARARLEGILHPRIQALRTEWMQREAAAGARLVVTEIPLLFEVGAQDDYDTIVLVDAPVPLRLERLVETRGLEPEVARQMIDAQLPVEEKRARSDVVILNDADPETLRRRALEALEALKVRS